MHPILPPGGPADSCAAIRQLRAVLALLFPLFIPFLSGAVHAQLGPALAVPYVPTPQNVVDRMLQMADVKASDYVMDVGCGDGRLVVSAARDYGARGLCNDIDPVRIQEAKLNARRAGVMDKLDFRQGDLYEVDLGQADVLPMYLLESINLKLRPKILASAKPGTRVVSHAFSMGDWKPDLKETVDGRTVYFWLVPARVDGRWQVREGEGKGGFELTIRQQYQEFTGQARMKGKRLPVRDGRIQGKDIRFSVESAPGQVRHYRGRFNGQAIEAVAGDGPSWLATRR